MQASIGCSYLFWPTGPYCITWGVKGALRAKTASDYFIAGREISIWVFVLAATATSFSGWTFVGHPALVWRDGFPYAYASFYAITIPFTGVLFLKRQWLLGKKYGFVAPGEMFSTYFKSDTMRILTVIVALFFSVPYLGVQLRASGYLFNVLTDGMFSVNLGMILLASVVTIYVAMGGPISCLRGYGPVHPAGLGDRFPGHPPRFPCGRSPTRTQNRFHFSK